MTAAARRWQVAAATLFALFGVVLVRTAWLSDDAYITLRTVDNFVNGYGLRWNVVERVQTYTHPLWMFLLAVPYAVTREPFFTMVLPQIAIALVTVWMLAFRIAADRLTACVALVLLVFSKGFVEYSTSGLENPLTHLLLVMFLAAFWHEPRSQRALWLLASLLMLTRIDAGLLVLPMLFVVWRDVSRGSRLRDAAIGLSPLVAWEVFSLIYYGVPFPNTAYAKLQTGVAAPDLMRQGLLYFADGLERDPVTLGATVVVATAAVMRDPRGAWPVAAGIALYYTYVVRIGGDFMMGRFFSAPYVCAVALFARQSWAAWPRAVAAGAIATVALGTFATTRPPITSGSETFVLYGPAGMGRSGIADERAFYYRYTGLLRWTREVPLPHNEEEVRGRDTRLGGARVVEQASIGLFGYFAGPEIHIVDPFAIGDPLLARLPARPNWRIGHFQRDIPQGYFESIEHGRNQIYDSTIAAQYERIRTVTQGPLWSRRRWRAIRQLNLGW
jgi:arabinofuranosyltransferase